MSSPCRILLVEDSPTQAQVLRRLFEAQKWEVAHAVSAEAALAEVREQRPDLIVLDYFLPGMNGDEFCREIRMNLNTQGIPILMLTAQGANDAETRGLQSGADDYLAKSADSDILLLRVRALLRKSQQSSEILAKPADVFTKARVLAIDDSPTYLEYLHQELASENYIVETALRGREGVELLRREPFDCVLVDLEMPDMSGLEVCRTLAGMRNGVGRSMAVVMLTGHEEKEWMTQALESGADDFIGKSSDAAVIKARIRALLRRKFLTEQNRLILEEIKNKELEAVRARAEKEAAELRAAMAGKLAESNRELEDSNRKLQDALEVTRAITQNAAEGLFMIDAQGRTTFANPAAEQIFGFSESELLGHVLHEKIHHQRPDGTPWPFEDCPIMRSLRSGVPIIGHEDVFFRKDGTPVDVTCSNAPILKDGIPSAAVLVVRDVSEQKRSEARLREAQKLESIGLLAGGIAHDFNNLLTGVIGSASLAKEFVLPVSPVNPLLDQILKMGEQLAHLTRQMLAYSGKGQFLLQPVNLSEIVTEMDSLFQSSVSKKIVLNFDLDPGLPAIEADRSQMHQVVMNLVLNAAEAIGNDPGLILVRTSVSDVDEHYIRQFPEAAGLNPGKYVCIEVRDSGCGMDDATRARIFDPFFSTKFVGRGLGLAAVSGIVRGHKGAITVSSAPGHGSCFTVLLPVCEGAQPASAPATQYRDLRGKGTILVVDDEAVVRELAKKTLERYGYEVLLASGGLSAIEILKNSSRQISLVLLDLSMPGMNGDEVLPAIRQQIAGAKVVVSSGYTESETMKLFRGQSVSGFIQKPYTSTRLATEVRRVL